MNQAPSHCGMCGSPLPGGGDRGCPDCRWVSAPPDTDETLERIGTLEHEVSVRLPGEPLGDDLVARIRTVLHHPAARSLRNTLLAEAETEEEARDLIDTVGHWHESTVRALLKREPTTALVLHAMGTGILTNDFLLYLARNEPFRSEPPIRERIIGAGREFGCRDLWPDANGTERRQILEAMCAAGENVLRAWLQTVIPENPDAAPDDLVPLLDQAPDTLRPAVMAGIARLRGRRPRGRGR